jgi:uncharacterized protein with gpF-like domain
MTLAEAAARLQFAAIGTLKQRQKDRLAAKHQPKIAAFFRSQKRQVLAALSQEKYLFTESYRQLSEEITQLTLQNWDRIWDKIASDSLPDLQKVVFNAEAEGVIQGAEQLKKVLPFNAKSTFNLANPRAVKWFTDKGGSVDYIKGINSTTADSLKRVISTALDEGWSYQSTAREIQKLYDGPISRARAQRIAVFETGQAYEKGNELFARSLEDDGVTMEESWQTSKDSKVRPEHTANEAEGWVPLGHVFNSGDSEPPTDPGCRCYKIWRQAPK